MANLLDFPSCTFPVTVGVSALDCPSDGCELQPLLSYHRPSELIRYPTVANNDSEGLPVGLQVMCRRHQEEKVIGMVEAIRDSLAQTSG